MKRGRRIRKERYEYELAVHLLTCPICNCLVTGVKCDKVEDIHKRRGKLDANT